MQSQMEEYFAGVEEIEVRDGEWRFYHPDGDLVLKVYNVPKDSEFWMISSYNLEQENEADSFVID